MTKFVKWTLVDAVTGLPTTNLTGAKHPSIPGLNFKLHYGINWYGTCDDSAVNTIQIPAVIVPAGGVLTQEVVVPAGGILTPAVIDENGVITTPAVIAQQDTVISPDVIASVDTEVTLARTEVVVTPAECKAVVLSLSELNTELASIFNELKNDKLSQVWFLAKAKREQYTGREYHPTEISAGNNKFKEANAVIAATTPEDAITAAPGLALEATTRGINLVDLAMKVIEKYNNFVQLEAVIAGTSGKIADQIKALTYIPAQLWDNFNTLEIDVNQGWIV